MSSSVKNPMDRFAVILSGIVISAIGFLFYNVLPLFLGTAQDFRELSDQAVGIGIMAAPALGGFITGAYGYESILWVGGIAVIFALTVSILASRLGIPIVQKKRAEKKLEALEPLT